MCLHGTGSGAGLCAHRTSLCLQKQEETWGLLWRWKYNFPADSERWLLQALLVLPPSTCRRGSCPSGSHVEEAGGDHLCSSHHCIAKDTAPMQALARLQR